MNPLYSTKESSKTFFHFKITSDVDISVPIVIKNMKILQYFSSVTNILVRMSSLMRYTEFVWVKNIVKAGPL